MKVRCSARVAQPVRRDAPFRGRPTSTFSRPLSRSSTTINSVVPRFSTIKHSQQAQLFQLNHAVSTLRAPSQHIKLHRIVPQINTASITFQHIKLHHQVRNQSNLFPQKLNTGHRRRGDITYLKKRDGQMRVVDPEIRFNQQLRHLLRQGRLKEAEDMLFGRWILEFASPNDFSFSLYITKMLEMRRTTEAERAFNYMKADTTFQVTTAMYNTMISGYMNLQDMDRAMAYFGEMKMNNVAPDDRTWTSILNGLLKWQRIDEALKIASTITDKNIFHYNTLINGLLRSKRTPEAMKMYEEMQSRGVKLDQFTYSALVGGLIFNGEKDQAMQILNNATKEGLKPNLRLLTTIFKSLLQTNCVDEALKIKDQILATNKVDPLIVDHLVAALVKADRLEDCLTLFQEAKRRMNPAESTYCSIINMLMYRNKNAEAFKLFEELQRMVPTPDVLTYTCVVHNLMNQGNVEEAAKYFEEMKRRGLKPDEIAYRSFIGGLLRYNRLDEAFEMLKLMKADGFEPNNIIYTSFMQRLRKHGNEEGVQNLVLEIEKSQKKTEYREQQRWRQSKQSATGVVLVPNNESWA